MRHKTLLGRLKLSALGAALLLAGTAHASVTTVYAPDFAAVQGNELQGWRKEGGYHEPHIVMDWNTNTASGLPALFLDSMFYEPNGGPEASMDTTLIGDTGVEVEPGASYRLSFLLARARTGGPKSSEVGFFGGLRYQLWAGDPVAGGVLLSEGRLAALREGDPVKDVVLSLTSTPERKGTGKLFIRITTIGAPAQGEQPYRYQQAEINDLRVEKVMR
jgi:hypothetical protein